MRDKNHLIKTVIVREDSNYNWKIIAKRGNRLIEETEPQSNFTKVLKEARFNHCLFDDEPTEPQIERFDDSNFIEKSLTKVGEWCEKSFDKALKVVTR
tara:strand:- start:426 stop:719 length:294 start_codon:yes stop_codon:yes gene_type:complete